MLKSKIIHISNLALCTILINQGVLAENEQKLSFNPNFLDSENVNLFMYEQGNQEPGQYKVNIFLNDDFKKTKDILFMGNDNNFSILGKNRGLYPCINKDLLQSLGVDIQSLNIVDDRCLTVDKLVEDAAVSYNFIQDKLNIFIPQIYVQNSARGEIPVSDWETGINAGYLNYNFNSNHDDGSNSYFLGLESGLNLGSWRLRNNSTYVFNATKSNTIKQWNLINTYLERPILSIKSNLVIGESFTPGFIFENIGFKGVRVSSAEEMKPASLQGFSPTIKGIAQSRAKVTIYQNGNLLSQIYVPPGPFIINDLFPSGSNGNLEVLIEEDDGTTKKISVPFSVLPILQRENTFIYDLTTGRFFSKNVYQDDPFFMQGTLSYGLNNYLTIYGGGQLASKYKALSIGVGGNLGLYGAISLDITHANSELFNGSKNSGQSMRFLYSKNLETSGTAFRLLGYRYSTKRFYTLNDVTYIGQDGYDYEQVTDQNGNVIQRPYSYYNLQNTRRSRFLLNVSQNLNNYGSLFTSVDYQNYWKGDKNENISVGYLVSLKEVNYSFSYNANKNIGFDGTEKIFALGISYSLENLFRKIKKSAYITTNYSESNQKGGGGYIGLHGQLFEDKNLSYNIAVSDNKKTNGFLNSSFNYNGSYGAVGAGYFYNNDTKKGTFSTNASGGALFHRNGVTIGQSLGGTNILVQAKGASSLPVIGQTGVKTDFRGYAIVPYAEAYRSNKVALDTRYLKENVELEHNIKFTVPTKGAIVIAKFNPKLGYRVLVNFTEDGKPIPLGSLVSNENDSSESVIGENGVAYIPGLEKVGILKVNTGTRSSPKLCMSPYTISDEDLSDPVIILNLDCKYE